MRVINRIIQNLGRPGYKIDQEISTRDLSIIVVKRLFSLMRGIWNKIWMGRSRGFFFVGKRCTLIHKYNMYMGRTVTLGDYVKINALCRHGVHLGNYVSIHDNTTIDCTGVIRNIGNGIKIGNNVGISENCHFQVRGNVEIGDDVLFGPNVTIISESHNFDRLSESISTQGEERIGVNIGSGCWIGANVTILDGVNIGGNCIIGAGSVVISDIPEEAVAVGIPATVKKNRGEKV